MSSPVTNPFQLRVVFNEVLWNKFRTSPFCGQDATNQETEVEVARYTKDLLFTAMCISVLACVMSSGKAYGNTKLDKTLDKVLPDIDHLAILLLGGGELGLEAVDLRLEGCNLFL
jgi:hypothetical protein